MGGRGSGRYEYASTPTVEECHHLDVDGLKELAKQPGETAGMLWGDREDPTATIAVRSEGAATLEDADRAARLRLQYTVTHRRTDEEHEYDYTVALEYTECHFGGYRPWVRCPECGTRRRKLYLPPTGFTFNCRECHGLGYTSSRTSGDDVKQAELRYRRAFAKADAKDRRPHPNGEPYHPERPKGMHTDTFNELLTDVWEARGEWDEAMQARTRELLNHYQDETAVGD